MAVTGRLLQLAERHHAAVQRQDLVDGEPLLRDYSRAELSAICVAGRKPRQCSLTYFQLATPT